MTPVENNEPAKPGPRPARTPAGRRLSATRAALLETLQDQPEPTSLPALVAKSGLHPNTVREHLDGLRRVGLVERRTARPSGRGRPGWLYTATQQSLEDPRPEYAGLAAALAAVIARTSPDPERDARAAGADWGRRLAHDVERPGSRAGRAAGGPRDGAGDGSGDGAGDGPGDGARDGEEPARRTVTALFDDMGFAPEPDHDATEVRLTRCPLLEAAHQQPDIVCSVHLGIAEGALETYGAGTEGLELLPFHEPGACLLRLRDRR